MNIVLLEPLGVPEEVLNLCVKPLLEGGHTFRSYPKSTDPQVQIDRAKDADVIMIANMPLTGEVIAACPNLKLIDVAFTGVDHVDLEAARAKGVKVSNAAGYSNQAVAELTLCMMLSLLRNVPQVEARCRTGGTKDGLVGSELQGKTVGIVGTGAIGQRTAALCRAFGCKVLGYRRHLKGDEPGFIEYVPLEELLSRSDIVSLHCPLNDSSRNLINRDTIARMKDGVIILNNSRGPLVVEQDLADALNSGKVYAAGLDVVSTEPIRGDNPLLKAKNCIITPHISWAPKESRQRIMDATVRNVRAWMDGAPINVVNQ